MLTSNVQVKQQMLGHSHELMTIYCHHASDEDRRAAADTVGEWLNRAAREA